MVGATAYTDHATPGCGFHLHFTGLESAVGLRPALWTLGLFQNLPLPPRLLDRYRIILGGDRGTWCEQLAQRRYAAAPREFLIDTGTREAACWMDVTETSFLIFLLQCHMTATELFMVRQNEWLFLPISYIW